MNRIRHCAGIAFRRYEGVSLVLPLHPIRDDFPVGVNRPNGARCKGVRFTACLGMSPSGRVDGMILAFGQKSFHRGATRARDRGLVFVEDETMDFVDQINGSMLQIVAPNT